MAIAVALGFFVFSIIWAIVLLYYPPFVVDHSRPENLQLYQILYIVSFILIGAELLAGWLAGLLMLRKQRVIGLALLMSAAATTVLCGAYFNFANTYPF
jgi:MFS family permease